MTRASETGAPVDTWDDIVVGAGSAGCVVANRLSADPSRRVLLLEAGPPDVAWMKSYAASWYVDLSRFEWSLWSQPDPSRAMRTEQWRRGRVLGGTSSINGMCWVRGARADYDRWAAMGNTGWAADDVMPLFQALERVQAGFATPPDFALRGRSGPVPIREVRGGHVVTRAFIAAAQAAGFPRVADYNGTHQEGVAFAQLNQRRGMRCSAADVFLKPVLHRRNLRLLTDALVHRLDVRDGRVAGVRFEQGGFVQEVRARRVVLCAGALKTPQILMLSGIGDAAALQALGIEVVLDRPAVGRNLMEHPLLRPSYRARRPTYSPTGGWTQKLGFAADFLLRGQGPIASPLEALAFLRTTPAEPVPDVQVTFAPIGVIYSDDPKVHKGLTMLPFPSFSFFVDKNHPRSRGSVTLASADPHVAPRIEPNLLGDERDVITLVRAVEMLRRIAGTAPLADMVLDEVEPGSRCTRFDDLAAYVRARTGLSYHPSGTCRMGPDVDAVVSPGLKLRGLENLWVADASVMPDLISGNINAACTMIGEKLARQLLAAGAR